MVMIMDTSSINTKLPKHLINAFKDISTSTLSDVMDSLGISGVIHGLIPIVEEKRLVGSAVPVKAVCGVRGTYPLADFAIGSIIDNASAGDVVIIDVDGNPVSSWGGLASQAAIIKGLAGVVVDGGVRDLDEIRQLKFPVFANHRVPTSGKTRIKIQSINDPIECRNVKIRYGDIIVGDSTGLAVIPSNRASKILQKAEALEEIERKFELDLKNGHSFQEAAKRLRHL